MKRKFFNFSQRYRNALRTHLKQGQFDTLESAEKLGCQAARAGFEMMDLVRLHEEAVVKELVQSRPADQRAEHIQQAGLFLTQMIVAIGETDPSVRTASSPLNQIIATLSRRTVELAASNLELNQEIAERKAAEASYKKNANQSGELLEQARRLSRQILSDQEVERKKISKDLHDVIVQTLAGINIRLTTLKKEAKLNLKGFEDKITSTQRLIDQSVKRIHRFTIELHSTVLDDLGLIPALHSLLKKFTEQTGIHTRLKAYAGVEQLATTRRTVFFRVAEEALTYVAGLTESSLAEVEIQKLDDCVCMKIITDGKLVKEGSLLSGKGGSSIEPLRMRERLEMIGGKFEIKSMRGRGITLVAKIPARKTKSSD